MVLALGWCLCEVQSFSDLSVKKNRRCVDMAEPEVVDSEVLSTTHPAAKDEAAEVDVTAKPSPAPRLKKLRREQEKTDTGEEAGVSVDGGEQVVKQGDCANVAHPPPAHLPALLHLPDVTVTSPPASLCQWE
jgi:hypothetical protein